MKKESYNVAVAGATGAVGRQMLQVLEERNFPVATLKPLASSRSAGTTVEFKGKEVTVQELTANSFDDVDVALFSPGGAVSQEFAPIAGKAGAVVIDNTSAFRMDPDVPLVVPEVNPGAIAGYTKRNIIANPNCSTIQMVVALKPLHDAAKIKRVIVSTYQSVSGAGQKGIEELSNQTKDLLAMKEVKCEKFAHRIAFNCLPHIDVFQENGYTKEEMKMTLETKKILGDESVIVSATAVRVPVFYSHSESITIETEKKLTADQVREILSKAPGVIVQDDPANNVYPLASEAAGHDETYVGRIREDLAFENGITMWVVADNIRKGAATNAVQIAERLIQDYL
ncbi:MAG: aspartate-semialdehyde dehydrogenase [Chrysiogenetes bacterium]|nr:aspartate-semialdehyde dehydrogenase [Chrysiogenetes bacterium]